MLSDASKRIRPRRRTDLEAFPVADELVLVPPATDQVFALNASGAAIWQLCDGRRSLLDILAALVSRFDGDDLDILADLSAALFELQTFGLIETAAPALPAQGDPTAVVLGAPRARPAVHFVFGVEDRTYFHWQLAILFESLRGQLPPGWSVAVVVCNGHAPVSPELTAIAAAYDVLLLSGESLGDLHDIDFADGGERYVPLNRIEALAVIGEHIPPNDVVCLMDTDTFLFGDLQEDLFPTDNAMAKNWIISEERFFQFATENQHGVSLPKLLEALGCAQEFKPGGVSVFLTGETLHNRKVIKDCFRFAQVLYLLAKISDVPPKGVWVSEMACFALALVPNDVPMELLDVQQFAVQEPGVATVPEGTFFHYYNDFNDGGGGPFPGSSWHKQLFHHRDLLREDLSGYRAAAQSPLEQRFFELAHDAQRRLHGTHDPA